MISKKTWGIGLGAAGLLVAAVAVAQVHDAHSQGDAHAGHEGHTASDAQLSLNDGQKWKTDAPLRAGMEALRDDVAAAVKPIHAKTYTPAQYTALAGKIEKQLVSIMAQCKLPPDADAQLHVLLVEFFGGVETMKKDGDRMQGVVRIIKALGAYEQYFDHAGWKALDH